jgi:Gnt-I system low-affinity gluconate transporter
VISGPIFGSYISNKIEVAIPDYMGETMEDKKSHVAPGMIITIIFIPILLMVINTAIKHIPQTAWPIPSAFTVWIGLIGHPFTALIIANLLGWYFLGLRQGMTRDDIQEMWSKSLAPAGLIILLTGAGGMFKQILIDTGAGAMLARSLAGDTTTPIMFAFICSALVRVIQGSATVAMITSAGLTAPLLLSFGGAEVYKALVVIAIASGATMMSHVNDSGFWLVNRYFGLTERQTLQSWTILTVILGLTGFLIALILSMVI